MGKFTCEWESEVVDEHYDYISTILNDMSVILVVRFNIKISFRNFSTAGLQYISQFRYEFSVFSHYPAISLFSVGNPKEWNMTALRSSQPSSSFVYNIRTA